MSTQLPRLTEHGYDVVGYLGKGSEGAVFKAKYLGQQPKGTLQPGQHVAIKVTPCDKVRPNEVLLQARIQHINVIRLHDVFRVEDKEGVLFLAIVMEIADPSTYRLPGSSLWNCIEATVNENMRKVVFQRDPHTNIRPPIIGGEPMVRWIFLQVASALDYLHRHPLGICNRDVKPENVLVVTFEPHADGVQRPVCKLADFGFSKALSSRESATRLGTAFYVAPEIYLLKTDRSEAYNGAKADVWSAGILLYTLVSGLRPFQEREDDQETAIMLRATKERHVAALFTRLERLNASPELINLLRGMLRADANRRLSMLEVIQHPWSRKLNQDIKATVPVRPENGAAANGPPQTVQQALPCWDWLFSAAQRTIEDAQREFAHSAAQAQGGPAPFVSHGWSLPYSYESVSQMLEEIKAVGTEVANSRKLLRQRSERSTSATTSAAANAAVHNVEHRRPHTARPHHSPSPHHSPTRSPSPERRSPTRPAPAYTAPVGRTTPRGGFNGGFNGATTS